MSLLGPKLTQIAFKIATVGPTKLKDRFRAEDRRLENQKEFFKHSRAHLNHSGENRRLTILKKNVVIRR